MADKVVGVDLGGTQIRAVLAETDGKVLVRKATSTQAQEGPERVIQRMCELVAEVIGHEQPRAIGIGAPGPTDPYEGVLLMGPNLPGWLRVNLSRALGDVFGMPVFVGNDANLAGLAEHRFGAGRGVTNMVYITVSTGIGTGVIINDRMLLGSHGLAAELGHITIDVDAEKYAPGVIGTLEGLASGPNIARRAQAALQAGAQSRVAELAGGEIAAVSAVTLNEAARMGDVFALEQFQIAARYLGIGITNILHIFDPQRIVIGGGVWMHCHDFLVPTVWTTIKERVKSPEYWLDLEIVSAALGGDVGLLGAVALAVDGLHGTREA